MIKILSVISSSPAAKAGILPGESIVSINSEPVLDEIDYQALIQHPHLEIEVSGIEGRIRQISVAKSAWASLGLQLDETVAMKPRHCRNHCVFCFIDQMPPGMRKTLYVKDDDWRLSLMMGNYVTLTNVDDQEFIRILKRKASPLYISVQATDPEVRIRMLRNPNAGNILQRLKDLKNHGICFHTQIVLCPGYNDGKVLEKTIEDLAGLWPATLSVAIVPVGMTKYRENLSQIPAVDRDQASRLIDSIEIYQKKFFNSFGTRLVFLSDEFYCLCGREIPEEETYEDYPQIENGIGMIRQFEEECVSCWEDYCSTPVPEAFSERKEKIIIPTGVSVFPYIKRLAEKYAPAWTETKVIPVRNRYFGESITVTGLIVGKDLIHAVKDQDFDRMLISESMLRENTDRFLDDLTLQEVRNTVKGDIVIVPNHGENFIRALYHLEDENE